MTFISLRKAAPAAQEPPGLEDSAEEPPQASAEAAEPPAEGERPIGFLRALAQGVRGWLTWCSSLIGAGATYGVHIVAVWAAGHYSAWITWGIIIGLAAAVARHMPRGPLDRLAERIEQRTTRRPGPSPEDGPAGGGEEAPADPLPALLWQLIGEAPGVHLKTVTAVLAEAAQKEGMPVPSQADVEASLQALQIPQRKSVRDTRDKVNRGVHREDLQAALQTPPPTPAPAPATDP